MRKIAIPRTQEINVFDLVSKFCSNSFVSWHLIVMSAFFIVIFFFTYKGYTIIKPTQTIIWSNECHDPRHMVV